MEQPLSGTKRTPKPVPLSPPKRKRCAFCEDRFDFIRATARFCSERCKKAHQRRRQARLVLSTIRGSNADLIAAACRLYAQPGARIADVTYGHGAFWRKVNLDRFELMPSDLMPREPHVRPMDFRSLAYPDAHVDVVVFDPPYVHDPGNNRLIERRYANCATTAGLDHAGIIQLYRQGMAEAGRIVRPGGQVWVKVQDEIESGKQRWSHLEVHQIARDLGLSGRDLLVLAPSSVTPRRARWERQLHARRSHSYLWVFDRPRKTPLLHHSSSQV